MNKKNKFTELLEGRMELVEAEEGKPRSIRVNGAMTAEVVNGNRRVYPSSVLEAAVAELRDHLNESAGQGRAIRILGEAEHPSDKGGRANLLETVTKWNEVTFDGSKVDIVGHVLPTSKGRDILTLLENGVMPGVSMRGYGEGKTEGKGDEKIFRVSDLHITGFDLVLEPSFENQVSLLESQNQIDDAEASGETEMSEELLTKLQDQEKEKAELNARLEEAQKSIAEGEKAKAELEEGKRKEAVEAAIAEVTKDLPFGKELNEAFVESIKEAELSTPDAVKKFAESKRKEYGKLAAKGQLKGMGFDEKKGLVVLGSVLENETGTPEFARASFELTEAIHNVEYRPRHDMRDPKGPNEMFAAQLVKRFDQLYESQLIAEYKQLQEAQTTADLNLPYAVSRAIIEEAFPDLIAAGIFDVGVIDTSPTRIFYEAFAGESGYAGTATDEAVTGGAEDVWYALAHGRITPDTVVVTSDPAGTTYEEGVDFVIDYAAGKIKFLTAGSIGANDVLVDYSYVAVRSGEMVPIERAKVGLTSQVIEAAADRLATQISSEAIVFSRSQLGYDDVARKMLNLIKQLRRNIDTGLMYAAFSAVKSLPNNSTDTWTVGTTQDSLDELVRLMGAAHILVDSRFYSPTFYLMSKVNAERLSHWNGYKRDGFPNAVMAAAGFAGGVNGIPIFAGTEFPSTLILTGNRELVQHRVFKPMAIKGPFASYAGSGDTTRLVAAEQYYAEEYNFTGSFVPGKGAFVPVNDAGS